MTLKDRLNKKIVCYVGPGNTSFYLKEEFSKYFRIIGFDVNEN